MFMTGSPICGSLVWDIPVEMLEVSKLQIWMDVVINGKRHEGFVRSWADAQYHVCSPYLDLLPADAGKDGAARQGVYLRGRHRFDFRFTVPEDTPGTIMHQAFNVAFNLHAVAEIIPPAGAPPQPPLNIVSHIIVFNKKDLIHYAEPQPVRVEAKHKTMNVTCTADTNTFLRGQEVPLKLEIQNLSGKTINEVKMDLRQYWRYKWKLEGKNDVFEDEELRKKGDDKKLAELDLKNNLEKANDKESASPPEGWGVNFPNKEAVTQDVKWVVPQAIHSVDSKFCQVVHVIRIRLSKDVALKVPIKICTGPPRFQPPNTPPQQEAEEALNALPKDPQHWDPVAVRRFFRYKLQNLKVEQLVHDWHMTGDMLLSMTTPQMWVDVGVEDEKERDVLQATVETLSKVKAAMPVPAKVPAPVREIPNLTALKIEIDHALGGMMQAIMSRLERMEQRMVMIESKICGEDALRSPHGQAPPGYRGEHKGH